MTIRYHEGPVPPQADLLSLYDAVGWSAYTRDPALLNDAVAASLAAVTAHDGDDLVGLARVVGDGRTIVYLQDVLVRPSHHRRGIGWELVRRVFAPFAAVRQKVLLTDAEQGQREFYEALGFTEIGDLDHPIRAFVNLTPGFAPGGGRSV